MIVRAINNVDGCQRWSERLKKTTHRTIYDASPYTFIGHMSNKKSMATHGDAAKKAIEVELVAHAHQVQHIEGIPTCIATVDVAKTANIVCTT